MVQCQYIKSDGKQCDRQASQKSGHNPQFCWQHNNLKHTGGFVPPDPSEDKFIVQTPVAHGKPRNIVVSQEPPPVQTPVAHGRPRSLAFSQEKTSKQPTTNIHPVRQLTEEECQKEVDK